ncbi:MAG: hypothetical protein WAN56_00935 [Halobacteriota archaeon]
MRYHYINDINAKSNDDGKTNDANTIAGSNIPTKAKATSTPRLLVASKQASGQPSASGSNSPIAAKSASPMPDDASMLGTSVPAAQTSGVASLPSQPVPEFSLLGLGIPALVAGSIYLPIKR